ncbi:MAG: GT4 family glycosyltransferase PelF [Alphaproteobacteria bacterium]|nr:GT4 family glycosyltransferase PelF [Alphaproteobacteria bacterium]
MSLGKDADICLILEGTYPYVAGGVAGWTHDLIRNQPHLKFALISLLPRDEAEPELKYELPENVVSLKQLYLQRLPVGKTLLPRESHNLFDKVEGVLEAITTDKASLKDFEQIVDTFNPYVNTLGQATLLDSEQAFQLMSEMYESDFSQSSFLDYFWSWRAVLAGLFSLVEFELPRAGLYHAVSTGYAGLLAARAKLETGKPTLITEHGIYTNERRIEIASAEWLTEGASKALTISQTRIDLRDLWTTAFINYSRIAYEAADEIITLFADNQRAQITDGASEDKLRVIPNGIDIEKYSNIERVPHQRPVVAMIGRVVPVKDVKAFIRAVSILKERLGDIEAYIIGPDDEDRSYAAECRSMVEHLGLQDHLIFTGRVDIMQYLPRIDLIGFSSISEAQPLVVLEVGASGIPVVSTDVGACREMLLGSPSEEPPLGEGGIIVPPANPTALANGMYNLLTDKARYAAASSAMKQRVAKYYNKKDQHESYRDLYHNYLNIDQKGAA